MRWRDASDTVGPPLRLAVAPAALLLKMPPARGAIAVKLTNFLLERSDMTECLLSRLLARRGPRAQSSTLLRNQYGIFLPWRHNVPERHHGVVFMHHVMAVDGVLAQPVAEAEEEFHPLVGMQLGHVLAPQVPRHGRLHPVAAHNLMLLQVDVDGVRPIAREVAQDPVLDAVLRDGEAESLGEAA